MVEAILKGFLFLVQTLYNLLLSPILSGIISLFPATATLFTYITSFFTYALYYVAFVRELLLIPASLMTLLFDYFLIKYSIHLILIAVRFAMNIYQKFKP